jgi:hypothetical protein
MDDTQVSINGDDEILRPPCSLSAVMVSSYCGATQVIQTLRELIFDTETDVSSTKTKIL